MAARALLHVDAREAGQVVHCGIYVRISSDPRGTELGVSRQEEGCRGYAERRGWVVYQVYCDNDTSAYQAPGKRVTRKRKAWSQLIEDVKAGRVQAVVAWHLDRLTRRPRELEDLIDFAHEYNLQLGTVTGEIDLSTATGQLLARQLGSLARYESHHRGERVAWQQKQQAEAGVMPSHGMRCFGYTRAGKIVPEEAEAITEAADRVLRGESLRSISIDWKRRGIKTVQGNDWPSAGIKRILTNPRIAGKRVHRGVVIGDGKWDPIIEPSKQAKVVAVLTDSSRLTNGSIGNSSARKHLLTGILRCGLCGAKLNPQPSPAGKPGYACRPAPPKNGCGKIRIAAESLEADVAERILARLASPAIRQRMQAAAAVTGESGEMLADQIQQAEQRLNELADDWAEGLITREQRIRATTKLEAKVAELRAAVQRVARVEALPEFTTVQAMADWWEHEATLERKRDLILAHVEHIEIKPATRRGFRRFDEDRVVYIWR